MPTAADPRVHAPSSPWSQRWSCVVPGSVPPVTGWPGLAPPYGRRQTSENIRRHSSRLDRQFTAKAKPTDDRRVLSTLDPMGGWWRRTQAEWGRGPRKHAGTNPAALMSRLGLQTPRRTLTRPTAAANSLSSQQPGGIRPDSQAGQEDAWLACLRSDRNRFGPGQHGTTLSILCQGKVHPTAARSPGGSAGRPPRIAVPPVGGDDRVPNVAGSRKSRPVARSPGRRIPAPMTTLRRISSPTSACRSVSHDVRLWVSSPKRSSNSGPYDHTGAVRQSGRPPSRGNKRRRGRRRLPGRALGQQGPNNVAWVRPATWSAARGRGYGLPDDAPWPHPGGGCGCG